MITRDLTVFGCWGKTRQRITGLWASSCLEHGTSLKRICLTWQSTQKPRGNKVWQPEGGIPGVSTPSRLTAKQHLSGPKTSVYIENESFLLSWILAAPLTSTYLLAARHGQLMDVHMVISKQPPNFQATGCAPGLQSNRISYFFNLRRPSLIVDTACSSSLVALVGGCRLNITPDYFVTISTSQWVHPINRYSISTRSIITLTGNPNP